MLKQCDRVSVAVTDLDATRRFFRLPGFDEERAVVISGASVDKTENYVFYGAL